MKDIDWYYSLQTVDFNIIRLSKRDRPLLPGALLVILHETWVGYSLIIKDLIFKKLRHFEHIYLCVNIIPSPRRNLRSEWHNLFVKYDSFAFGKTSIDFNYCCYNSMSKSLISSKLNTMAYS